MRPLSVFVGRIVPPKSYVEGLPPVPENATLQMYLVTRKSD